MSSSAIKRCSISKQRGAEISSKLMPPKVGAIDGSAVLGLGNVGPLASKPVMEGKAVLFKKFADIDGFDIEVDTQEVDEFVQLMQQVLQPLIFL
jgi:malic enzyme